MRNMSTMFLWMMSASTAILLVSCGDSHPLPTATTQASSATAAKPAVSYTPSTGAFAAITPAAASAATTNCNLDSIDGSPVGSKPLARGQSVEFAGWAASIDGTKVPRTVQLELLGSKDFGVSVPTGASRPDVALATHHPQLGSAGYVIRASLEGVAAGTYKVALSYRIDGKALQCQIPRSVTIQ